MLGDKLRKLFSRKQENNDNNINNEETNGIKEIIRGDGTGNDKRKIENLVFFVVLLIITIVIINFIWNGNEEANNNKITNDTSKKLATSENINQGTTQTNETGSNNINSTENLEKKLKNILSKIQGVGEVEVCLNYSESSEVVAMYNENSTTSTTEETDDSGGTRKIEETDTKKDVIFGEDNGTKTPITAKVVEPKIEGAIITAQGASNIEIKNNVIQAVEAVTGLATHKIQVFQMNS